MVAGGVLNTNLDVKPGLKRSLKVGVTPDVTENRARYTFFIPSGWGGLDQGSTFVQNNLSHFFMAYRIFCFCNFVILVNVYRYCFGEFMRCKINRRRGLSGYIPA